MKYLDYYCQKFNLKVVNYKVFDASDKVVGVVQEDKKYIHFSEKNRFLKMSDLLLLAIEEISVHD